MLLGANAMNDFYGSINDYFELAEFRLSFVYEERTLAAKKCVIK